MHADTEVVPNGGRFAFGDVDIRGLVLARRIRLPDEQRHVSRFSHSDALGGAGNVFDPRSIPALGDRIIRNREMGDQGSALNQSRFFFLSREPPAFFSQSE